MSYIWEVTKPNGEARDIAVDIVRREGGRWVRDRPSLVRPDAETRVQHAILVTLLNAFQAPVQAELYVGIVREAGGDLEVHRTEQRRFPVGTTDVRIPVGAPVPGDQAAANASIPLGGFISLTPTGGS